MSGWAPGPQAGPPAGEEVQVWRIDLDVTEPQLGAVAGLLSPDEHERARRFRTDALRRRFLASHGVLRRLLGDCLGEAPETLRYSLSPLGKPSLSPPHDTRLCFSLAHSEDQALVALAAPRPLGVDLERARAFPDAAQIVARFFSPRERLAFESLAAEQREAAFFRAWTRKEALLKASGEGLDGLAAVEVALDPLAPARLSGHPAGPAEAVAWQLRDLGDLPGFAAAVAVRASALTLTLRCWSWPRSPASEAARSP